jgi:hypothetical protein
MRRSTSHQFSGNGKIISTDYNEKTHVCPDRATLGATSDNAAMETDPPKVEPPKRKRRWYQFRLRTLMIAVTLLAVPLGYVGWQVRIVRHRDELRRELAAHGGGSVTATKLIVELTAHGQKCDEPPNLSWIRELVGDEYVYFLYVPETVPKELADDLKAEFPEARVIDKAFLPPY